MLVDGFIMHLFFFMRFPFLNEFTHSLTTLCTDSSACLSNRHLALPVSSKFSFRILDKYVTSTFGAQFKTQALSWMNCS